MLTIIGSLKNVGISISLDDFGTGYASLAQVNRLPLDRIKIDKSFITTIVKSEQTAAIVNTIAGLGHNLDVPITAEGVESEQIRSALADFGCSEAQGWLFGRAISGDAVRAFLDLGSNEIRERGRSLWQPRSGQAQSQPPLVRARWACSSSGLAPHRPDKGRQAADQRGESNQECGIKDEHEARLHAFMFIICSLSSIGKFLLLLHLSSRLRL